MKKTLFALIALVFVVEGCNNKTEKFNGIDLDMGNLYRMSDAQSRSISPENFTGEKGKGGMEGESFHLYRAG